MTTKSAMVIFDENCNLCAKAARLIKQWGKSEEIELIPQQSTEGIKYLKRHSLYESDSITLVHNGKVFIESDAVAEISKHLRFPWNLAVLLKVFPKKFRDKIYRFIARNRYKWFGKNNHQCNCKIEN